MKSIVTILTTIIILMIASMSVAEVPQMINYQGRLTDATGDPVADGSYNIVFRIYDRADILVLPSYTEGSPRVIAEAYARGLPVIASDVGSIPYMVQNGTNGILVTPGKADEICEALTYLIENPLKKELMASTAVEGCKQYMIEYQAELVKRNLCRIEFSDQGVPHNCIK